MKNEIVGLGQCILAKTIHPFEFPSDLLHRLIDFAGDLLGFQIMQNSLTWLHLSDIHFRPKTEWRDSPVRKRLIEYLRAMIAADEKMRPDFIFCTGDIAFGESSTAPLGDQYEQAKNFFDLLLAACGQHDVPLAKERLFVVPGNHDVNRKQINADAQSNLIQKAEEADKHVDTINQRFEDRNFEFKDAIKRLDEYGKFVEEYLPHQHDANGRHQFNCKVAFGDLTIGVSGFNSSWSCAGPEDDRNIWLAANWQFGNAYEELSGADIKIGLMHHPVDWLNVVDRDAATRGIAADFNFWLHGHSHNAWVVAVQSHVTVAAGAVGAATSDEFGINLVRIDRLSQSGIVYLHSKKAGASGWTIAPVATHAPKGEWPFPLPPISKWFAPPPVNSLAHDRKDMLVADTPAQKRIGELLAQRLDNALTAFSYQPKVWIAPILSTKAETAENAKTGTRIDALELIKSPKSIFVKAPAQYGLTCLSHFLASEAWKIDRSSLWLYMDARQLQPHPRAIEKAIAQEIEFLGASEKDVKGIILDSWSALDKDAQKLLTNVCKRFERLPVICMQHAPSDAFFQTSKITPPRAFEILYLWGLPRGQIRQIVAAYNNERNIGDEDSITARIVADLTLLNLHRTPLNCLTLLRVSELDFDESPVNRSEMLRRVLFLLFNVDKIPTYTIRPDLKDCEYVLGYFCETLIRGGDYCFSRDQFLRSINMCCAERLIDLDTRIVFDVLAANHIIVQRGALFHFKFSYWIFYFGAQRMVDDPAFASFIFEDMRYIGFLEIIELYTGTDRRRNDALKVLIADIKTLNACVKKTCGFPEDFDPYKHFKWTPTVNTRKAMLQEVADGVRDSNLPAAIKDQYVDRDYDLARPYDQSIHDVLTDRTFMRMLRAMKAGARALRNSDYVPPEAKRALLAEILNSWEQASKVLLVVLPLLAKEGFAEYDGTSIALRGDFGSTPTERAQNILDQIPVNIVTWCEEDLFSRKMGTLLSEQLSNKAVSDMSKHELILLLIRKRPQHWETHVKHYIVANERNSFYLFDINSALRTEYKYGFASPQTLLDIEHLIKMVATKHLTGEKAPGIKSIAKEDMRSNISIPTRELDDEEKG